MAEGSMGNRLVTEWDAARREGWVDSREAMVGDVEAARRLGLSVSTLRAWRVRGGGPVFRKLGTAVRYTIADLDAFVESRGRKSTSDPGGQGEAA